MTTIAGETQDQTIARLESDVAALEGDLKRAETARDEAKEMSDNLQHKCDRQQEELNFLREQIAELALQIASPSAPSHKSDMARLLEGILAKDDWRNGAWRRKRPLRSRESAIRAAFLAGVEHGDGWSNQSSREAAVGSDDEAAAEYVRGQQ